ncbi:UDP-glucose 4-epimerase GalE [Anaerovoracaceae bacterium SGI.195]
MKNKFLLTGGLGYIGSHTAVALIESGYDVVILDNLYNSSKDTLNKIHEITNVKPDFFLCDVRDNKLLVEILKQNFDAVIHLAGYKSVNESIKNPIKYYDNNIGGLLNLIDAMDKTGCNNLVFSSSATVYGIENKSPLYENMKMGTCTNPYGNSKKMAEQILRDVSVSKPEMSIVALRYFNPVGAHPSGKIGEVHLDTPNNLMPYISGVASGKYEILSIFGNDYNTEDGTCIRDFVHVCDLAKGHVKGIEYTLNSNGYDAINLGSGLGYSVLELVNAFESENGLSIKKIFEKRRPGDIAICYANIDKAKRLLDWIPQYDIKDICRDTWNFEKNLK